MKDAPLILISPSTQRQGIEFADASISLSNRYSESVAEAGGIPVVIPCTASAGLVAETIRRCAGVILTGGDDVQPRLYAPKLSVKLAQTVTDTEPERDLLELLIIDAVFRQRKPLLAICRGLQVLNVALGGTLIADIPTQISGALDHRRMEAKCEQVHDVELTPDSLLAKITGKQKLGVNSTHHQAVGRVADPLRVTGKSSDGIIEVMELKTKNSLPFLLALQFHPERLADRHREFLKIFQYFAGRCRMESAKKL
ncbi:MAG: gamma-glutamyl-gamma-aminobutyrate hydrolase family protein [Verrucomicrobiota bacterium]